MKLLLLLVLSVTAWADVVDYSGYRVYRLTPRSEEDIQRLWDVKNAYDNLMDFWRDPASVGVPVDLMVPGGVLPGPLSDLLTTLHADVMIQDVQELMDTERSHNPERRVLDSYSQYGEPWASFGIHIASGHPAVMGTWCTDPKWDRQLLAASSANLAGGKIEQWLLDNCQGNCNLVPIGESYEGRQMYVAQIGGDTDKPILFLECGIHAREWISPAVCLNIINRLVNEGVDDMLLDYNFHIITNTNPDGYEFTFTDNRMWRKTRSPNAGSSCFGCDPNRNFEYEWGGAGTSNSPCSDLYRGPSAFSEVETSNVRDYVSPRASRIRAYYAVHSYGQWVLIPWSYEKNLYPNDFLEMKEVGDAAAAAIQTTSGLTYVVGQSADLLGETAGCSDDWAKGSMEIKFAYTLELRDTGRYGFILPEDQIQPNFEEIWASFEAMVDLMSTKYPGP